jgi:hypothetical protein
MKSLGQAAVPEADAADRLNRLALTCFYTPDFEPMLIRFISGITDPVNFRCFNLDAEGVGGTGGGRKVWQFKTEKLIECADPKAGPAGEVVVFMDIDIAVYREMKADLHAALDDADMVFQRERGLGKEQANIGVIAFRRSAAVADFWTDVLTIVTETGRWDQEVVNRLIANDYYLRRLDLRVGFLPPAFWARSQIGAVPVQGCILHHANCVSGMTGKWVQLNAFRELFEPSGQKSAWAFRTVRDLLPEAEWSFGEFSKPLPYGRMRFDAGLRVIDYAHENESCLELREQCMFMLSRNGHVTCNFNEFYIDHVRNRAAAIGPVFHDWPLRREEPSHFHYLIASF